MVWQPLLYLTGECVESRLPCLKLWPCLLPCSPHPIRLQQQISSKESETCSGTYLLWTIFLTIGVFNWLELWRNLRQLMLFKIGAFLIRSVQLVVAFYSSGWFPRPSLPTIFKGNTPRNFAIPWELSFHLQHFSTSCLSFPAFHSIQRCLQKGAKLAGT